MYETTVMSGVKIRKWCHDSRNARTNVHDEERSGRSNIQINEIVFEVDQELRSNRPLTISELVEKFLHLERITVYNIVIIFSDTTNGVHSGQRK